MKLKINIKTYIFLQNLLNFNLEEFLNIFKKIIHKMIKLYNYYKNIKKYNKQLYQMNFKNMKQIKELNQIIFIKILNIF